MESPNSSPIRNNDFLAKVEDEIDQKTSYETFVAGPNTIKYLNLTQDEAMQMGMRESKTIRKQVIKWLRELSAPVVTNIEEQMIFAKYAIEGLNLQGSALLGVYQNIQANNGIPNMLPVYAIDAPEENALSSMPTHSASYLLKERDKPISSQAFNKLAAASGYLKKMERPSTNEAGFKKFWSITDKGLDYGKNMTTPKNEKETQPNWYDHKFDELLEIING